MLQHSTATPKNWDLMLVKLHFKMKGSINER